MAGERIKARRLRAAGYVPIRVGEVAGWVPAAYAARVTEQIGFHADDVRQIGVTPTGPVGRPKRKAGA